MLLLSTACLPHYGLERVFEFAKDTGFDGVEVVVDKRFDTQNAEYIKKLEKKYDLPVGAFSISAEETDKLLKPFQTTVREFKGVSMNLRSPELFGFEYKKWLQKVAPKLAKKYQLRLVRVNAPLKLYLGILPQYSQNSLGALSKNRAVGLDISALWSAKEDIEKATLTFGKRLQHMYISNVLHDISYSPMYEGSVAIERLLENMAKRGYKGHFTVLISPEQINEGNDEKVTEKLTRSVEFFRKHFIFAG